MAGNQAQIDRFLGVLTGTVPIREFFSPRNLMSILGLRGMAEALGLDRVHLLGHSWGGWLALEYALRRPAGLASGECELVDGKVRGIAVHTRCPCGRWRSSRS